MDSLAMSPDFTSLVDAIPGGSAVGAMLRPIERLFERNISHFPSGCLFYGYAHRFPLPVVEDLGLDPINTSHYVQRTWHYSVYLGIFYLFFCHWLQQWMQSRKPFSLRRALVLWNGALAVFSICGVIRTSEEFVHTVSHAGFYKSICYTFGPHSQVAYWFLYFGLSKVVELGDTAFLILKKRPLTLLHCWHHFSVLIYTWHSGSEYVAAGRWFMWMNYVAHSVMYSYFTAMAAGYKVPRSVARCVTIVQIMQMVIGVTISFIVLAVKSYWELPCQQTYANLYLSFVIYCSYMVLFIRFFIQAYCTTPTLKSKVLKEKLK